MKESMYQNIIVAIDPYAPAKVNHAIAVANKLKSEGGQVTLVTVVASIPAYVVEQLPKGQLELNRQEAESNLKEYASGSNDIEILAITSLSSAGAALVELSAKKKADLIVVASHRPGLKDYFLGSTAGRVVRHSPCAVHVVR